jgi:ABC-2 type transport system permease protein
MNLNLIGLGTMLRREVRRTLRVVVQTLLAPVISSALYLFIFGTVIGSQINEVAGVSYISFVFPGILMLSVINSSFASASSALYFMRFTRGIEEILISPFSYAEMLLGFVGSAVLRSLMVAFLILLVGVLFGAVSLVNPISFIFYAAIVSSIFALLGIVVALWSESFEQLQVVNTFVITPLTYLGGIFYSVSFLPPLAETITRFNPFFYFADGFRRSMIGVGEANVMIGVVLSLTLFATLFSLVILLFKRGWKIRS